MTRMALIRNRRYNTRPGAPKPRIRIYPVSVRPGETINQPCTQQNGEANWGEERNRQRQAPFEQEFARVSAPSARQTGHDEASNSANNATASGSTAPAARPEKVLSAASSAMPATKGQRATDLCNEAPAPGAELDKFVDRFLIFHTSHATNVP